MNINDKEKLLSKNKKDLLLESIDNIDCISQTTFWEESNGIKKIVYKGDLNNLKFYYEEPSQKLRCFEIESLQWLKKHNITIHPMSSYVFPSDLFDGIDIIDDDDNIPIYKLIDDLFKKFHDINNYPENEWFERLNRNELLTLYRELNDIWNQDFTQQEKNEIDRNSVFLKKKKSDLENFKEIVDIQKYILKQLNQILNNYGRNRAKLFIFIRKAFSYVIPEFDSEDLDVVDYNNNQIM